MRHAIVYARAGTFAGWPANNGLWSWEGREILVGLTTGPFAVKPGHNIDEPYRSALARSLDQGDTWTLVEPQGFVRSDAEPHARTHALNFDHPGFALRVEGTGYHGSTKPAGAFYASSDRGRRWHGPFSFGRLANDPELAGLEITSRTDYVIEGPRNGLVMMSARGGRLPTDKAFCARTSDGGCTFQFVSWLTPLTDPHRAVMPSTVRCASGDLVTTVRRREPGTERCWIDAYTSPDLGQSWLFAGKVADTGGWNGNPPALAALADGRLCCVRGERDTCRMLAKYSRDLGRTWSDDVVLRDDFQRDRFFDPDLGYPRVVQRADGRMLALYYWATALTPHQHIAASIWDPT